MFLRGYDTYEFIQTRDPAYIESNLPFTTFRNNNLNLIHYMNNDGEKVWHGFYNLETGKPFENDEFWSRSQWDLEEEPFLQIEGVEDSATGLIKLKQGVMLLAARPILRSSAVGEMRGRIIMGRLLKGEVSTYISQHMRNKVEFIPWTGLRQAAMMRNLLCCDVAKCPVLLPRKMMHTCVDVSPCLICGISL
ncbi:MAG: CHASE4 domain-containing protein [Desulfuromonadaceae bacterium]